MQFCFVQLISLPSKSIVGVIGEITSMLRILARFTVTGILLTATFLAVTASSCRQVSMPEDQQPIEIISVVGPLQPINPGGPIVEITLKNVAVEPIASLTATLELSRSFDFNFNVTPLNPLLPNKSIATKLTLIGGGFSDNVSYPLIINGSFQNGATFVYTKQVQIVEPAK